MQFYHLYDHSCTSCGKTDMPAYPHQPDAVSFMVSAARSSRRSLPARPSRPVSCRSSFGLPQYALRGSRHGSGPGNCCSQHPSSGTLRQMDDLTLSVSSAAPSIAGFILCSIWLTGVIAMLLIVMRSSVRLTALRRSALPLQSRTVRALYDDCLRELHT